MTNDMNNRQVRRNSDKARAITKAKARKTNILLSVGALALVAVIAASAFAFGIFNNNNNVKTATTTPTTISMKANENKAAQAVKQEAQTATQAEQAEVKQTTTQPAAQTTTQTAVQPAQNVAEQTQTAQTNTQSAQEAKKSEDKIETVNGERVYIDTKRTAPEKTGTPAHYYANGKTSYGFDWDYSGGGNFLLRCDYNFDQHQYDFQFYGVTPGTAHVTLYYFTADNVKVPVSLTVNVDSNLNVTVG